MKEKHNMCGCRLYRIWANMKNRCNCKNNDRYKNYGGRGIKVCDEWSSSFVKFKDWALMNGYNDNLTLDRIDVNGNYEPLNCRWITIFEQQSNRSNNRLITYNGETKALCEWARMYNLRWKTLQVRINSGWSIEKALNTKVETRVKRIILQYDKNMNFIKEYNKRKDIMEDFNINNIRNIINCCQNKIPSSYGYIWKYKEE